MKKYTTQSLIFAILKFNDGTQTMWTAINRQKINSVIEEFLIREDKDTFYEQLLNSFLITPPRHPDILHFYIRAFLGFNIPRKRYCRNHVAPFSFICDMYFDQCRNAIAFANRTGGKTLNIAILNHLDMAFKAGCEIASAGATRDQASKGYDYLLQFHIRNAYLQDLLLKDPIKSLTTYKNGSTTEIITGSVKGLNCPHPNKARIDEVELMDWNVLQEGLSMSMTTESPTTGKEILSQDIYSSTRKTDTGTMQRLLNLAKKEKRKHGGFKIYEWCIWEVLEKCNRKCKNDDYYGSCPIYDICCEGKAKNCDGFYKTDDFINKVITLDKDTLDAQWFNKKPSRQAFVYGDYWNREIHFIPRVELESRTIEIIGGIDFGSSPGHPFVYKEYVLDVTDFKREVEESEPDEVIRAKITFYLNYEYRSGKDTMEGHSEKIKGAPNWTSGMTIFADPSAKQSRIDLEELYGVSTYPANNAVEPGINSVRSHLHIIQKKANYYIYNDYLDCNEVDLIGTDSEFELYKYKRHRDGKINTKEPEKINDHGMDIDRYVISSSIPYLREKYTPEFEEVEQDGFWFGG